MSKELDEKLYVYPGTSVLRNTQNIRDKESLDKFERLNVIQRVREGVPDGNFDLTHLQSIHKHLLQDIYPWAGELRQVPLHKGGHQFFPPERLEMGMADIHKRIVKQGYLKGLDHKEFSKQAGEIIGDVNFLHPFRDGNGRTQLQYLKQLGETAGYQIEIGKFDKAEWIEASREAHMANYGPMSKVIFENSYAIEKSKDVGGVETSYREELETSGQKLAAVLKKPYVAREFEDKQTMRYVGFADMHSGRHVILSSVDDFTLVKMPRDMAKVRVNEPVDIEQTKSGLSITTNRRDITKDEAIQLAQEKSGLSYKDMDGGEQFAATYLGAVNLEEGVFAAVAHENELSFVKLKNYPVFKDNAEIVVSAGNDGFAEIKEANRQQELELESVKELEKNKDKDVEIDW